MEEDAEPIFEDVMMSSSEPVRRYEWRIWRHYGHWPGKEIQYIFFLLKYVKALV